MRHEEDRGQILLSFYNELSEEERSHLEAHLRQCESCRLERESLKRAFSALSSLSSAGPPEGLLPESRRELFRRMQEGEPLGSDSLAGAFLPGLWMALCSRGLQLGLAAAASLFVGLLIGYLTFGSGFDPIRLDLDRLAAGDLTIANVRFLEAHEGGIDVSFDLVRPARLSGAFGDEGIQRLLAYALVSDQNPGVRLRAAELITAEPLLRPDPEIRSALIAALKTDDNAAVRERAMKALARYSLSGEVKDAFLFVLRNDENAKLRIDAIERLERSLEEERTLDPSLLRELRKGIETEPNDYVRVRAEALLEKAGLRQ